MADHSSTSSNSGLRHSSTFPIAGHDAAQQHRPSIPSGLRQSTLLSTSPEALAHEQNGTSAEAEGQEDERTRLINGGPEYHSVQDGGENDSNHAIMSRRPRFLKGYGSMASGYGDSQSLSSGDHDQDQRGRRRGLNRTYRGDFVDGAMADDGSPRRLWSRALTTSWLAKKHNVKSVHWLYVSLHSNLVILLC